MKVPKRLVAVSREINLVTDEFLTRHRVKKPWEGPGQRCCWRESRWPTFVLSVAALGHVVTWHGRLPVDAAGHQILGWALAPEPARAGTERGHTVTLGAPGRSLGGWPPASPAPLPVAPSLDLQNPGLRGWAPRPRAAEAPRLSWPVQMGGGGGPLAGSLFSCSQRGPQKQVCDWTPHAQPRGPLSTS